MAKRYWGDIITSAPVNGVAARVTQRGFKYEPALKDRYHDSGLPLPLHPSPETFPLQLTGNRRGRITCLGPSVSTNGKGKRLYACRCDCGSYTLRTAKAIQNPANDADSCEGCRHLARIKNREVRRRTG
jgi:hypothetical protein